VILERICRAFSFLSKEVQTLSTASHAQNNFGAAARVLGNIKRASAIECELEALEARMSEGQPIDIAVYARLTRVLCRLFELIGIQALEQAARSDGRAC
jgi:hypothetical protein